MVSIEQANELIRNRRSIYPNSYSPEEISAEIIDNILENANWAPTHRLTEPWRFTVFSGQGLERFATFQAELYASSTPNDSFDQAIFEKLKNKPLKASHIISIGMKRDPRKSVPEMEEIASVCCAVQNMYLTAAAFGIGCYWTTGGVTYLEEAKEFFGLGPEDRILGFMYLGIPTINWPKGKRKPIAEKVRWES